MTVLFAEPTHVYFSAPLSCVFRAWGSRLKVLRITFFVARADCYFDCNRGRTLICYDRFYEA